jgi:hypothetical protein
LGVPFDLLWHRLGDARQDYFTTKAGRTRRIQLEVVYYEVFYNKSLRVLRAFVVKLFFLSVPKIVAVHPSPRTS